MGKNDSSGDRIVPEVNAPFFFEPQVVAPQAAPVVTVIPHKPHHHHHRSLHADVAAKSPAAAAAVEHRGPARHASTQHIDRPVADSTRALNYAEQGEKSLKVFRSVDHTNTALSKSELIKLNGKHDLPVQKFGKYLEQHTSVGLMRNAAGDLVPFKKSPEAFSHYCARRVVDAYNAIGIPVEHGDAKDLPTHLARQGFEKVDISHGYTAMAGDAVITLPDAGRYSIDKHGKKHHIGPAHPDGHISGNVDGHQFDSDARQKGMWVYSTTPEDSSRYVVMRHPDLAAQAQQLGLVGTKISFDQHGQHNNQVASLNKPHFPSLNN